MLNRLRNKLSKPTFFLPVAVLLLANTIAFGQSTAFTYQGKLSDTGSPVSGSYDLEFKLFDTQTMGTGTQQGLTVTVSSVTVANGIFTVQLDFGPGVFPGADRFLEIAVKPVAAGSFTTLSPRQQVTSTPYTIRSVSAATADTATNSTQLGGLTSSGFIQNTTTQQSSTNFSVSGNGALGGTLSASVVNTATQYNIGGSRVLSNAGSNNLFAGVNAGAGNTTGGNNSFVGISAGNQNTMGQNNTFFGQSAGSVNTNGSNNTMIGGLANLGSNNLTNATAIGANALVGANNSLVLGSINGLNGGTADTNVGIGTPLPVTRLHVAGNTGITGNLGVGTTAPAANLDIAVNAGHVLLGHAGCNPGFNAIGFAASLAGCVNFSLAGNGADTVLNRASGGGMFFREGNGNQMSIATGGAVTINGTLGVGSTLAIGGTLTIGTLGAIGLDSLCRNSTNQIASCSSSLRYKTDIAPFIDGLDLINRLCPIAFTWKQIGIRDIGLGAEDVAAAEPRLVTHNAQGQIEGVKYDHLTVVLINAIKEQQSQIKRQRQQIANHQDQLKQQQRQIEALKILVCLDHPNADVCK